MKLELKSDKFNFFFIFVAVSTKEVIKMHFYQLTINLIFPFFGFITLRKQLFFLSGQFCGSTMKQVEEKKKTFFPPTYNQGCQMA
jgi:hypothetical protein